MRKNNQMKDRSNINPISIKNGPNIDQKSSTIEAWRALGQVWKPLGPSWAIQSVFGGILDRLGGVLEASWRRLGGLLGGLGPRKVANMAPTWPSKRSQSPFKIDPKIDQFFSASWNRFLEGFWHQNRSKIDANCEKRFFEKSCSRCSGGSIFEILGVEVGSKNRLKIDQKTESKMDGILASIFLGF